MGQYQLYRQIITILNNSVFPQNWWECIAI